mmetsp:Transcript_28425/g.42162  ORF Transcript_28425/g.42162 Transcript_28425/m.42162 type:complete len:389 (-) Transcript_28425:193-1359(-)
MKILEGVHAFFNDVGKTFDKEKKAILELKSPEVDATINNLSKDTKGDNELIQQASKNIADLKSKLKYGILRCDYEYKPTRGDPGEQSSFSSDTNILKVEGWTFEAVQRGMTKNGTYPASEFRLRKADGSVDEYWTKLWNSFPDSDSDSAANRSGYVRVTKKVNGDKCIEGYFDEDDYTKGEVYRYEPEVIEQKMQKTVEKLEMSGVCGISADVGYSQAFQDNVREMASVPVVLSSLQQLSFVAPAYDLRPESNNKIMVMTANLKSFDLDTLIPPGVDKGCIKVVGAETGKFGKWVAGGNSFSRFKADAFDEASVEESLESMCALCQNGLDEVKEDGGAVVCIVQECSEMPAYSNGLRKRFNIPVYDTMTAVAFVQMGRDATQYSAYMM